MSNKKSNLGTYVTMVALGLNSLAGCSSYTKLASKQKDVGVPQFEFTPETKVYSLPLSYADSTGVKNYADTLTVKEIARNLGIETFRTINRFSVEKGLAKNLELEERFEDVGYYTVIDSTMTFPDMTEKQSGQRTTFEQAHEEQKQIQAFYNQGFLGNKWARRIGIPLVTAAIIYGGYKLNDNNSGNNSRNGLPEDPADTGISGGPGEVVDQSGDVRGGPGSVSQSGSNRQ